MSAIEIGSSGDETSCLNVVLTGDRVESDQVEGSEVMDGMAAATRRN